MMWYDLSMIVYMLLNTVTEKAYIGQTHLTLRERIRGHWDAARTGSTTPLHVAMREWDNVDLWLDVVLQNCYTDDQLNACEKAWIEKGSTYLGGVGYNAHRGGHPPQVIAANEKQRSKRQKHKQEMTEEQREVFRAYGRKGAVESAKRIALKIQQHH